MTFPRTPLTGLALRLLLAAACVMPFTSVASAVVYFPALAAPGNAGPAPVSEEDEREEEEVAEGRAAHDRRAPLDRPRVGTTLPVVRGKLRPFSGPARPTAADPFNNGLGTHFRC